jgi:hypothetical protein
MIERVPTSFAGDAVSPDLSAIMARALREQYDRLLTEPMPDRLAALLSQLDRPIN